MKRRVNRLEEQIIHRNETMQQSKTIIWLPVATSTPIDREKAKGVAISVNDDKRIIYQEEGESFDLLQKRADDLIRAMEHNDSTILAFYEYVQDANHYGQYGHTINSKGKQ